MSLALPTNDKSGSENDLMATIYADCLKKESISCIKYKVFTYVDKMLADKEDITLSEGITVVKTSNGEEGAPRSVVRDTLCEPRARPRQLTSNLGLGREANARRSTSRPNRGRGQLG